MGKDGLGDKGDVPCGDGGAGVETENPGLEMNAVVEAPEEIPDSQADSDVIMEEMDVSEKTSEDAIEDKGTYDDFTPADKALPLTDSSIQTKTKTHVFGSPTKPTTDPSLGDEPTRARDNAWLKQRLRSLRRQKSQLLTDIVWHLFI